VLVCMSYFYLSFQFCWTSLGQFGSFLLLVGYILCLSLFDQFLSRSARRLWRKFAFIIFVVIFVIPLVATHHLFLRLLYGDSLRVPRWELKTFLRALKEMVGG
jgi:hypothetical protein